MILKKTRGFTLIELMIVVAIVAILAAVAIPSYQQYIQKSRRVDAKETLTRMAALQERFFFQNSAYTTDINDLGGETSPEGWYRITMPVVTDSTFTIIATAIAPPQSNDTRCRSFSIDQALRQTATGTDSDNCW